MHSFLGAAGVQLSMRKRERLAVANLTDEHG
jgi:hypothetical protein